MGHAVLINKLKIKKRERQTERVEDQESGRQRERERTTEREDFTTIKIFHENVWLRPVFEEMMLNHKKVTTEIFLSNASELL